MRILFVCSGNIMRSVIAECACLYRSRQLLGRSSAALLAESSGLDARNGSSPHPQALSALEQLGIPIRRIFSSPVDEKMLARADLAATMTRQQCYLLANRFPQHSARCFSLLELNGSIETLLAERGLVAGDPGLLLRARSMRLDELEGRLADAARLLATTPRLELRPLAGVDMGVVELMRRFPTCFHQVSGIHDPVGGTDEEVLSCARIIDREVTLFLKGIITLASS